MTTAMRCARSVSAANEAMARPCWSSLASRRSTLPWPSGSKDALVAVISWGRPLFATMGITAAAWLLLIGPIIASMPVSIRSRACATATSTSPLSSVAPQLDPQRPAVDQQAGLVDLLGREGRCH